MREVFDNMKIYDFANLDSIEIENGISFVIMTHVMVVMTCVMENGKFYFVI